MEIFHLRYFAAVAEHLSFSKAAREMHMATSPLSQRIKDLERELGTVLFDRDSRSVSLTPAGEALVPLAANVIQLFDEIPQQLRAAKSVNRPRLLVGVAPWLDVSLRHSLRDFSKKVQDQFILEPWPASSHDLLAEVRSGKLAFALVHLPAQGAGITSHELLSEELGALLPAEQFGERKSVSLSELTDFTYVSTPAETRPTYYDQVEVRISAAGIHKRQRLRSGDFSSPAEVVASGHAFSLTLLDIPGRTADGEESGVVALPFSDFSPRLPSGLIYQSERASAGGELAELLPAVLDFLLHTMHTRDHG